MPNIQNYFSPGNSGKRGRAQSSPEQADIEKLRKFKKGELAKMPENVDIVKQLEKMLERKFAEVASKDDVNKILAEINLVKEENVRLSKEVENLSRENREVKKRLIELENRSRRNNLIFKGLKTDGSCSAEDLVKSFCVERLGVREGLWINRAHPLGSGKSDSLIIAHIPDDGDLNFILKNTKKLKGTDYAVFKDFSSETRLVRKKLFALKSVVKKLSPNTSAFVTVDKLIVAGKTFTMEDGSLRGRGDDDGIRELAEIIECDSGLLDNCWHEQRKGKREN